MKHTLVCFIFLTALQDGNTGCFVGGYHRIQAVEGGNITFACPFESSGEEKKLFCKEKCEDGGVLVETSADAAQRGRYSIEYEKKSDIAPYHILYMSITQLKKSDSGRYRCSLDIPYWPDSSKDFELIVTEASTTSAPNVTPRPFSASGFLSSASKAPPTLSVSSASGSSTPPSASTGSSDVLLYVRLILVVMVTIFLASLLIFYKKRRVTKPRGRPVEDEYDDITQGIQMCEEIREEGMQSGSPSAEVSSIYTTPNAANHTELKS